MSPEQFEKLEKYLETVAAGLATKEEYETVVNDLADQLAEIRKDNEALKTANERWSEQGNSLRAELDDTKRRFAEFEEQTKAKLEAAESRAAAAEKKDEKAKEQIEEMKTQVADAKKKADEAERERDKRVQEAKARDDGNQKSLQAKDDMIEKLRAELDEAKAAGDQHDAKSKKKDKGGA